MEKGGGLVKRITDVVLVEEESGRGLGILCAVGRMVVNALELCVQKARVLVNV